MSKLGEIASGIKNKIKSDLKLTSEEEDFLFAERRKICDSCEYGKNGSICDKCKCILVLKTKSLLTSCPEGHW